MKSGKSSKNNIHIKNTDFIKVDYSIVSNMHKLGINSWVEIMIMCKIVSLSSKGKVCEAQNIYFAELLECSQRHVENSIKDLREKGLITTYDIPAKLDGKGKYYTPKRYIYIGKPVREWVGRKIDFAIDPYGKIKTPKECER